MQKTKDERTTVSGKCIENPKIRESNYLIIFAESPRDTELFFMRVKRVSLHYSQVPKVPKKRKVKSGKEHTGKGNLGDQDHRRQRIRTQMIDGNSQSDVTEEDLEELSRSPKNIKTPHLFGHCQIVCQDGAKL